MPELPEVETIRRGLAEALPGTRITGLDVRLPKIYQVTEQVSGVPDVATPGYPVKEIPERVIGATVKDIRRRGKLLMIGLSTDSTLLIHLKMTGQLIFQERQKVVLAGGHPVPPLAMETELPNKFTHVIFSFDDGSELFYNDLRQFGYIKLVANADLPDVPLLRAFGPEPLEDGFSLAVFTERLRRRPNAKLKPLLLDQTFVAGLGNIYVDEALNLAKLHPLRTAGSLKSAQRAALHAAIRQVLQDSLNYGGTSANTYVNVRGGKGDYLNHARVYHRTGLSCRACGTLIRRLVVAGRGTHVCPRCQRPPRVTHPTSRATAVRTAALKIRVSQ